MYYFFREDVESDRCCNFTSNKESGGSPVGKGLPLNSEVNDSNPCGSCSRRALCVKSCYF